MEKNKDFITISHFKYKKSKKLKKKDIIKMLNEYFGDYKFESIEISDIILKKDCGGYPSKYVEELLKTEIKLSFKPKEGKINE